MFDQQKIAVVAVAEVVGPIAPATTPTFRNYPTPLGAPSSSFANCGFTGVVQSAPGVYVLTLDQNVAGQTLADSVTTLLLKVTGNGDTLGTLLPMKCSATWTTANTITVKTANAATGALQEGNFTIQVKRVTDH
jgi:hypothetical protein